MTIPQAASTKKINTFRLSLQLGRWLQQNTVEVIFATIVG